MRRSRSLVLPGLVVAGLVAASLVFVAIALLLIPGHSLATPSGDDLSFAERCGGHHVGRSVSIHGRNGRYDISVKRGRCRLDIEMRGGIEFLDDESGLAAMSRRARLEIRERVGRDERRIVVTPGAGGEPRYDVSVNGRAGEFDDEARAWLRDMLPEIFRTTGIDAEGRVGRLLARGGADAVLREVPLISGDRVQRIYLQELLRQARLGPGELEDVIDLAGDEIGSDFELAELLIGTAAHLDAESLRIAYARAVDEIGSDFEMRRALTPLVEGGELGDEALDVALRAARSIGSDFELAELLITVTRNLAEDRALPPSFARAIETIGSDFEHCRVLKTVLERQPLPRELFDALLATVDDVGSDFELAELLIKTVETYPEGEPLPAAFYTAVGTIGSDFDNRRVLSAVIAHRQLTGDAVAQLLASSSDVGSDFEMAELLISLARAYPIDDELRPAFTRALESVGSKFERQRVLAEIGQRPAGE